MLDRRRMLQASAAAALGGLAGCSGYRRPTPDAETDPPLRRALLVGVTHYAPGLVWKPLVGPANDVELWRSLLTQRYGFPEEGITRLTAATTPPTRENIRREFARLADEARPGGLVFILLSGHGSQQPDQVPPDPEDYEPNGMDQVFLPCDVGAADPVTKVIPNGIIDDELRRWLRAIAATGARVWLVCDCCHAGTMLRGQDEEGIRGLPAERVWPAEILAEARRNAGPPPSRGGGTSSMKVAHDKGIIGFYACAANEQTGEAFFPDASSPAAVKLGYFTQALCAVLSRSDKPVSYAELGRAVGPLYEGGPARRLRPTPFAEGDGLAGEVFGGPPEAPGYTLTKDGKLDGGQLHGLFPGAVLSVGGRWTARVVSSDLLTARVEGSGWPDGTRATLSAPGATPQTVCVAVGDVPGRAAILKRLTSLPLVSVVEAGPDAWKLNAAGGRLVLAAPTVPGPRFNLPPNADGIDVVLASAAKVQNLLWLAANVPGPGLGLEVELLRVSDEKALKGEALSLGAKLHSGDWVRLAVRNRGERAVDITVLAIQPDLTIKPYLPDHLEAAGRQLPGRIPPGGEGGTLPSELFGEEPETDRLFLLAVEAVGEKPANFGWLADLHRGKEAPGSPLARFLASSLFGNSPRGSPAPTSRYQLAARSWVTLPKR